MWFDGHLTYTLTADGGDTVLRQQETLRIRRGLGRLRGLVDRRLRPGVTSRLDEIRETLEPR